MNFLSKLKQKAKELKSEAQVLLIAYSDKRTPIYTIFKLISFE